MKTTDERSRARIVLTTMVTVAILVSEFSFLSWLYHLDEDPQARLRTAEGAQVALATWRPGADRTPATVELRRLTDTGIEGSDRVRTLTEAWTDGDDSAALVELRDAVDGATRTARAEVGSVDRQVSLILVVVLLLISVGWFVWFRRLVQRHRQVQAQLTERETVHAGERRLLALVRSSTDVVLVLDADSTATFASPAVATVLGRPAEEVVGQPVSDLLAEADRPVLRQLLYSSRSEDFAVQLRMHHHDGRELVMEGTLTNLRSDPAVEGYVLTVRDVTERQRLQDDLVRQAFHDSLTGLANRQLFTDRLSHALERRSDRNAHPAAVLFLDLDDFKDVNDSLGHAAGDELLVAVAERIATALRSGDTAARLGGDEFAVLLEDTDLAAATQVAHQVLAELAEPIVLDGGTHHVRASIGLAEAAPGRSDGAETLRNADVAMYMAKERGKGGVAIYDSAEHQRALETMALRTELELAIERDELVLHYQPTIDLDSHVVTGFEALVRWQHPRRGLLAPAEFVGLAERSGLIVPLGTWVLRRAVRDCASLQGPQHRPSVAVNVAAKQLTRPDFVQVVLTALADAGLPADRLVLEITETTLLEDLDLCSRVLSQLRRFGLRIAIDDFGTGYSSLSHLARLPVDVLKVDRSFIQQLNGDDSDVLVSAILAMSRGLELTTVAEGVEEVDQARWLTEAQCDLGQGFLWSRPVELEAARELLGSFEATRTHETVEVTALGA